MKSSPLWVDLKVRRISVADWSADFVREHPLRPGPVLLVTAWKVLRLPWEVSHIHLLWAVTAAMSKGTQTTDFWTLQNGERVLFHLRLNLNIQVDLTGFFFAEKIRTWNRVEAMGLIERVNDIMQAITSTDKQQQQPRNVALDVRFKEYRALQQSRLII